MDKETKILDWLATGKVGISSKTMAFASIGRAHLLSCRDVPYDPSDFNRCLLLVEAVPEVKDSFSDIAAISDRWAKVIEHWDDIQSCFITEVGRNWCNGNRAPKTYRLMKKLIFDQEVD